MMERWEKSQERRREVVLLHNHNHNHNQNPSFSSTLLDSIYRSIDEPNGNINNLKEAEAEEEELIFYKETSMMMMKKKKQQQQQQQQVSSCNTTSTHEARWTTEHVQDWRVPISTELQNPKMMNIKPIKTKINNIIPLSSSSSSSSQEKVANNKPKSSTTSSSTSINNININGSFVKTRSKAMKLYSDLKKVKQPISPGGKLATFLNSIFSTAGNAKKPKISTSLSSSSNSNSSSSYSNSNFSSSKFDQQTPSCSSTSSFSRSCLSKTPSSSRANVKRSVRFYPVSVIVDEDSKPCGHKNLHETNSSSTSTKLVSELIEVRVMEENRRVVEAAKELLKNYHKKKEEYEHVINNGGGGGGGDMEIDLHLDLEDDDDDDDDLASCASSDLFELDNLSVVGVDNINHQIRYREELPVYETTYVRANRAIANAFIL
ncbi:hypothetical protein ACFE04_003914 [Oxalis oulophora]